MAYTPTSYYGHSVKDRTSEFHGLVESIASRSSQPPAKQKLLNNAQASSSKGEFARRAQAIGKDIASTTAKLQRLAQCAFPLEPNLRGPLKTELTFVPFALLILVDSGASQDALRRPTVEISELTYIIKHDIAAINKQLADLQAFNKANRSGKPPTAQKSTVQRRHAAPEQARRRHHLVPGYPRGAHPEHEGLQGPL